MAPRKLFEKFKEIEPEIASTIIGYKASKQSDHAIDMRDNKGTHCIFEWNGDSDWTIYYGQKAIAYERGS